jgi:hypothetical protein
MRRDRSLGHLTRISSPRCASMVTRVNHLRNETTPPRDGAPTRNMSGRKNDTYHGRILHPEDDAYHHHLAEQGG